MKEEVFILDGFRTLGLVSNTCIISYTTNDDFVVIEKEIFNGIKGFKMFTNEIDVDKKIDSYLLAMGLESRSNIDAIAGYVNKAMQIMNGFEAIDKESVAKVIKSNKSELGYFDLGNGKIILYSDGNVELHSKNIISLGNIKDIIKYSVRLGRDIIKGNYGTVAGVNVEIIKIGLNKLNEIYDEFINNKGNGNSNSVNAKGIEENKSDINKSRELALCIIATRATQHLCNGRKWDKKYLVAKDLYLNVYEKIYEKWIKSGEQFSFQFIDKVLNDEFFKPMENVKLTV